MDVIELIKTRFEESGALQNTLLIIMGDHGNRVTRMSRTNVNLCCHCFYRSNFIQSYPENWQNLLVNTQRFTSNFDVHETLLDIIEGKIGVNRPGKRGISLFRRIPTNRSCIENNVVHNFCLCMEPEPEGEQSKINRLSMLVSLRQYMERHGCLRLNSIHCHSE
ncbi:hypothetical protein COOONC_10035, partial [Cooperia oncophora]